MVTPCLVTSNRRRCHFVENRPENYIRDDTIHVIPNIGRVSYKLCQANTTERQDAFAVVLVVRNVQAVRKNSEVDVWGI